MCLQSRNSGIKCWKSIFKKGNVETSLNKNVSASNSAANNSYTQCILKSVEPMQGVNFLRPPLDRSVTASENVVIWSIETDIVD